MVWISNVDGAADDGTGLALCVYLSKGNIQGIIAGKGTIVNRRSGCWIAPIQV